METGYKAKLDDLAVNGGTKLRVDDWPVRKLFGLEEKKAVEELMEQAIREGSHIIGYNGAQEQAYCKQFAESLGGGFADGVNSGTNALYIALKALELEPGSEVIVPAISDPGGVMPVALCNCIPVPADTDGDTFNIGAEQIKERITDRTRAIVVAHIAGIPAEMDEILELAKEHGLLVVEDCAQAHGAVYKNQPVGTLGDIAAFSTMSGKHHSTGGQGGLVFTRNEQLHLKARRYCDRGKPFGLDNVKKNIVAALNCNMDELHATIGRVQLKRLPGFVETRRKLGTMIVQGCKEKLRAIRVVDPPVHSKSSYWFLVLNFDFSNLTVNKDVLVEALTSEGIAVGASYNHIPMQMPWTENTTVCSPKNGCEAISDKDYKLPNAEAIIERCSIIPLHEGCGQQEAEDIIAALVKIEQAFLIPPEKSGDIKIENIKPFKKSRKRMSYKNE